MVVRLTLPWTDIVNVVNDGQIDMRGGQIDKHEASWFWRNDVLTTAAMCNGEWA